MWLLYVHRVFEKSDATFLPFAAFILSWLYSWFPLLLKLQLEHKEDHVTFTFTFHQSVNSGSLHYIKLHYYIMLKYHHVLVKKLVGISNVVIFSYFHYYQSDSQYKVSLYFIGYIYLFISFILSHYALLLIVALFTLNNEHDM